VSVAETVGLYIKFIELVHENDWSKILEFAVGDLRIFLTGPERNLSEYEWKGDYQEDARYTVRARRDLMEKITRELLLR
jgi:hypothetical protein